jgi:hypothetical protein
MNKLLTKENIEKKQRMIEKFLGSPVDAIRENVNYRSFIKEIYDWLEDVKGGLRE